MPAKKTETKATVVKPEPIKMKPYSEMTKEEMIKLNLYPDIIEDHFPE